MSRVVSLLPAATEIVAALGATDSLVGISHECDYPPSVRHLPRVTQSGVDASLAGGAIDAGVRQLRDAGQPVITIDQALLRSLRPSVVLTQDLCGVCAVDDGQLLSLSEALDPAPEVVCLSGRTLEGVETDFLRVGRALDQEDDAVELVAGMRYRLGHLPGEAPASRPRVVSVEWLEPLYLAGHWVPELVAAAGGEEVGGEAGTRSRRRAWAEVAAMRPDVLLIMLCGFGIKRAQDEWAAFARANPGVISLLGPARVRFVDGNAFTSRPGPRLVEAAAAIRAALKT